jgi:hypothetical protein
MIVKETFWGASDINLCGWRVCALLAFIFMPIIYLCGGVVIGYQSLMYGGEQYKFVLTWLCYGLPLVAIWSVFSWDFARLINRSAIPVRWPLCPIRDLAIMVYVNNNERSVKFYEPTALCPICESHLEVIEGSGALKNRLIGQCRANRSEHQYSFDFTLETGKIF